MTAPAAPMNMQTMPMPGSATAPARRRQAEGRFGMQINGA
jgi:hypothetical protein